MNLKVNLLKEDELRQVGVSPKALAIRGAIIAFVVLIASGGAMFVLHFKTAGTLLTKAQHQWDKLEKDYKDTLKTRQENVTRRKLIAELKSWSNSRFAWSQPLYELQEITPLSIQLTKLNVRGEFLTIQGRAPPASEASGEGGDAAAAVPAVTVQRRFELEFFGTAIGALGDQVVIHFVRSLRQASAYEPVLESIKLQSLQKVDAEGGTTNQETRTFEINAISVARDMK